MLLLPCLQSLEFTHQTTQQRAARLSVMFSLQTVLTMASYNNVSPRLMEKVVSVTGGFAPNAPLKHSP